MSESRPPQPPPPPVDFLPETEEIRAQRQISGHKALTALCSALRGARSYSWEHEIFTPLLDTLHKAVLDLLGSEGTFALELAGDEFHVNGQAMALDPAAMPLAAALRTELRQRAVDGIRASLAPPKTDLQLLLRLFRPAPPPHLDDRGDPARPFKVLRLKLNANAPSSGLQERTVKLAEAYASAAAFVNGTIQQLRLGAPPLPIRMAAAIVQDLVDLQRSMPMRFLALARVKAEESERYWGVHAANVAVLAITFGSRLGLSKGRRHDLGMAALFHDVGMAAIPKTVLQRSGKLDEKGRRAVKASPLLSARAILRDGEVHFAALERAQGAYECHLDLVPQEGPLTEVGLAGRILAICESFDALTTARPFRAAHSPREAMRVMTTEQLFRFDPQLVDLFVNVVMRLFAATAPAG
ncbi:MAG TPA: HD domain-containing phosphohydrolase [Myxococcales bacterium]|nr:HD domain-containing phosphohydrolase [Myxococcales bacterium]